MAGLSDRDIPPAHRDVLAHEAKIVEHRLALVAMCEATYTDQMNRYLQKLAYLPRPTSDPQSR